MIAHRARGATVYNGECVQTMTTLATLGTTVDSIVTDPPYHLTTVKRFGGDGTDGLYQRASKGFMGKEWDGGGVVLDPFAGSGTLADAWSDTILIEREAEYYADILRRLER